ncbi:LytTR family DNA-binding domain-containing protein [Phenylobacterium sp.]|uniref:LytTR family DNA-binding domain-containing protein n=1 Tax=Phenylobacterium sp. TaxID=1871053 RepID=UPI0025F9A6DE|nr:LytTR family DNA-binding domain-containing protein [Phenylobacterium sp.]
MTKSGEEGDLEPATSDVVPPNRRLDAQFFVITAAFMAVFLYCNVLNIIYEHHRGGGRIAFWRPMVSETSSGLIFLVMVPAIQAITRRAWPTRGPWVRKALIHILAATGVSLIHVLGAGVLRWAAYRLAGDHYDPLSPLGDWPYEARKDVFVYVAIAGAYVLVREVMKRPAASPASGTADVLEVRDGARRHFVPLAEVVWVEAAGNYVELHRSGSGLLHRASLSDMERRLRGAGFVRIHRSRLVRREAVAAVESKSTGDFVVRLRGGGELAGSRRYRRPLLAD